MYSGFSMAQRRGIARKGSNWGKTVIVYIRDRQRVIIGERKETDSAPLQVHVVVARLGRRQSGRLLASLVLILKDAVLDMIRAVAIVAMNQRGKSRLLQGEGLCSAAVAHSTALLIYSQEC